MASLIPFRALRPAPEPQLTLRLCPTTSSPRTKRKRWPMATRSAFSILRAPRSICPAAPIRIPNVVYETARHNFSRLRQQAPLVVDEHPSAYRYRLRMGDHVQTGVAACFSVDEYDRDVIKKHEKTRRDKEDDRTRHMIEIKAQTGPVFLTYLASKAVDDTVARVTTGAPLYDFQAPDGVQSHRVASLEIRERDALVAAFAAIPCCTSPTATIGRPVRHGRARR